MAEGRKGKEEFDTIISQLKMYKNKILNKKEILLKYKLIPHSYQYGLRDLSQSV